MYCSQRDLGNPLSFFLKTLETITIAKSFTFQEFQLFLGMKFIKFLSKIGYAATTSFGFAALITGFISVTSLIIRFKSIQSFSEAMEINHSIFRIYVGPLSMFVFFVVLITYSIFAVLGKRKLIEKQMPF